MATKRDAAEEVAVEVNLTLDEFLSEFPTGKVEARGAFGAHARSEGYTAPRPRSEWRLLYEKYRSLPA